MHALVAMLIGLGTACYRPVTEASCAVVCGGSGECPAGLSCNAGGYCTTNATPCAVDVDDADAPIVDAATPCDPLTAFGAPLPLTELNSDSHEYSATLSPDRLTIYFDSTRENQGLDIYEAVRTSPTGRFDAVAKTPLVNSTLTDMQPVLSADGLTLYLSSDRASVGNSDIYIATRTDTSLIFGEPILRDVLTSTMGTDLPTAIDLSETTLFISSDSGGDWELYRATRASRDVPFEAPTKILELNVMDVEDYGAVFAHDQRTVYFESERAGGAGCGDIYLATRSGEGDEFDRAERVLELSSEACEWPTWVSPDGCEIILSSNRPGGRGGYDLWFATKR